MGFIEQAERLRQQHVREEQIKLETERKQIEAQLARQKAKEEDLSHVPKDNQTIAELLDNLPRFDIREYLKLVERHSGYTSELCLYTRAPKVLASDELADKLSKLGLKAEWEEWVAVTQGDSDVLCRKSLRTEHPEHMFFGVVINPTKGFLGIKPIVEPQEPGIGLYFTKHIKSNSLGTTREKYLAVDGKYYNGSLYSRTAIITNHVFVRFVLPSQAIITGDGTRIGVTDLKTF